MSNKHIQIYSYSNLPSGGAKTLEEAINSRFEKKTKIIRINDLNIKPSNIISYLYTIIIKLPRLHKKIGYEFQKNSILIAHHSWLTKSPHLLRYTNIPKIYICHEPPREFYDKDHIRGQNVYEKVINLLRLPIKYIDRSNLKSSKLKVIVNSKFSKKIIDNIYGINSILLYPGIVLSDFKSIRKIVKRNQVISVGAINRLKRFEYLIYVIGNVPQRYRPNLIIIGNGSNPKYELYLRNLSSELKVNLIIKKNVSRKELITEYFRSIIFLYAPINEPFGLVVQEAIAAGLPIVVYKNGGGYSEIVNKQNGFILNKLDINLWSESILELIKNKKKYQSISKFNFQFARKYFSINNMSDKLWEIINNL